MIKNAKPVMPGKHNLILRAISLCLIGTFLSQEISFCAPEGLLSALSKPLELILSDPSRFEAPLDFSTLKEIHKGTNGKLIIHIQDAHSNVSGQQNLASMLDALMEKYGVSLILSEGGSKDCSLTPIKDVAPASVWKNVAKSYLLQGKLTGEEYLNLVSDRPMKIMGLEDLGLYVKSVQSYGALARKREDILAYLAKAELAVDKLKNKQYPKELLEYEKTIDDRRETIGGSFEAGYKALFKMANEKNVDLSEFLALSQLVELTLEEKLIDFNVANLEQAALLDKIQEKGGGTALREQFSKLSQSKNQKLSRLAYLENTFAIAKEKNVPIDIYPNLKAYGEYLKHFASLDLEATLDQMEKAEEKVYVSVIASAEGAKQSMSDALIVHSVDSYLKLLRTAYRIQMTTKDFNRFQTDSPNFPTVSYLAYVNRKLADLGYFEDLVPYQGLFEEGKESLEGFYGSVEKRDFAFLENTEKIMNEENQKAAVLITGGYHTDHLMKLLEDKGYSIAVLSPIVSSETIQAKYEKRLLEPFQSETKKVTTVSGEAKSDASLASLEKIGKKDGVREALTALSLNNRPADGEELGRLLEVTGARLAELEASARIAAEISVAPVKKAAVTPAKERLQNLPLEVEAYGPLWALADTNPDFARKFGIELTSDRKKVRWTGVDDLNRRIERLGDWRFVQVDGVLSAEAFMRHLAHHELPIGNYHDVEVHLASYIVYLHFKDMMDFVAEKPKALVAFSDLESKVPNDKDNRRAYRWMWKMWGFMDTAGYGFDTWSFRAVARLLKKESEGSLEIRVADDLSSILPQVGTRTWIKKYVSDDVPSEVRKAAEKIEAQTSDTFISKDRVLEIAGEMKNMLYGPSGARLAEQSPLRQAIYGAALAALANLSACKPPEPSKEESPVIEVAIASQRQMHYGKWDGSHADELAKIHQLFKDLNGAVEAGSIPAAEADNRFRQYYNSLYAILESAGNPELIRGIDRSAWDEASIEKVHQNLRTYMASQGALIFFKGFGHFQITQNGVVTHDYVYRYIVPGDVLLTGEVSKDGVPVASTITGDILLQKNLSESNGLTIGYTPFIIKHNIDDNLARLKDLKTKLNEAAQKFGGGGNSLEVAVSRGFLIRNQKDAAAFAIMSLLYSKPEAEWGRNEVDATGRHELQHGLDAGRTDDEYTAELRARLASAYNYPFSAKIDLLTAGYAGPGNEPWQNAEYYIFQEIVSRVIKDPASYGIILDETRKLSPEVKQLWVVAQLDRIPDSQFRSLIKVIASEKGHADIFGARLAEEKSAGSNQVSEVEGMSVSEIFEHLQRFREKLLELDPFHQYRGELSQEVKDKISKFSEGGFHYFGMGYGSVVFTHDDYPNLVFKIPHKIVSDFNNELQSEMIQRMTHLAGNAATVEFIDGFKLIKFRGLPAMLSESGVTIQQRVQPVPESISDEEYLSLRQGLDDALASIGVRFVDTDRSNAGFLSDKEFVVLDLGALRDYGARLADAQGPVTDENWADREPAIRAAALEIYERIRGVVEKMDARRTNTLASQPERRKLETILVLSRLSWELVDLLRQPPTTPEEKVVLDTLKTGAPVAEYDLVNTATVITTLAQMSPESLEKEDVAGVLMKSVERIVQISRWLENYGKNGRPTLPIVRTRPDAQDELFIRLNSQEAPSGARLAENSGVTRRQALLGIGVAVVGGLVASKIEDNALKSKLSPDDIQNFRIYGEKRSELGPEIVGEHEMVVASVKEGVSLTTSPIKQGQCIALVARGADSNQDQKVILAHLTPGTLENGPFSEYQIENYARRVRDILDQNGMDPRSMHFSMLKLDESIGGYDQRMRNALMRVLGVGEDRMVFSESVGASNTSQMFVDLKVEEGGLVDVKVMSGAGLIYIPSMDKQYDLTLLGLGARLAQSDDWRQELAHLVHQLERAISKERAEREADRMQFAEQVAVAEKAAVTDALTGLPNRKYYDDIMKKFIELSRSRNFPLSIIMLDLDRFKEVNDMNGHVTGDQVLEYLGRVLKATARRNSDLIIHDREPVRYGGEEFIIVLPGSDAHGAATVAAAIKGILNLRLDPVEGVNDPKLWGRRLFEVKGADTDDRDITASFGVAQLEPDDTEETLRQRADEALYEAKNNGRNRVVIAGSTGARLAGSLEIITQPGETEEDALYRQLQLKSVNDLKNINRPVEIRSARVIEREKTRLVIELGFVGTLSGVEHPWSHKVTITTDNEGHKITQIRIDPKTEGLNRAQQNTLFINILSWLKDTQGFQKAVLPIYEPEGGGTDFLMGNLQTMKDSGQVASFSFDKDRKEINVDMNVAGARLSELPNKISSTDTLGDLAQLNPALAAKYEITLNEGERSVSWPGIERLNKLIESTGWMFIQTDGFLSDQKYVDHLANQQIPVGTLHDLETHLATQLLLLQFPDVMEHFHRDAKKLIELQLEANDVDSKIGALARNFDLGADSVFLSLLERENKDSLEEVIPALKKMLYGGSFSDGRIGQIAQELAEFLPVVELPSARPSGARMAEQVSIDEPILVDPDDIGDVFRAIRGADVYARFYDIANDLRGDDLRVLVLNPNQNAPDGSKTMIYSFRPWRNGSYEYVSSASTTLKDKKVSEPSTLVLPIAGNYGVMERTIRLLFKNNVIDEWESAEEGTIDLSQDAIDMYQRIERVEGAKDEPELVVELRPNHRYVVTRAQLGARLAAAPKDVLTSLKKIVDAMFQDSNIGKDEVARSLVVFDGKIQLVRKGLLKELARVHEEVDGSAARDDDGTFVSAISNVLKPLNEASSQLEFLRTVSEREDDSSRSATTRVVLKSIGSMLKSAIYQTEQEIEKIREKTSTDSLPVLTATLPMNSSQSVSPEIPLLVVSIGSALGKDAPKGDIPLADDTGGFIGARLSGTPGQMSAVLMNEFSVGAGFTGVLLTVPIPAAPARSVPLPVTDDKVAAQKIVPEWQKAAEQTVRLMTSAVVAAPGQAPVRLKVIGADLLLDSPQKRQMIKAALPFLEKRGVFLQFGRVENGKFVLDPDYDSLNSAAIPADAKESYIGARDSVQGLEIPGEAGIGLVQKENEHIIRILDTFIRMADIKRDGSPQNIKKNISAIADPLKVRLSGTAPMLYLHQVPADFNGENKKAYLDALEPFTILAMEFSIDEVLNYVSMVMKAVGSSA